MSKKAAIRLTLILVIVLAVGIYFWKRPSMTTDKAAGAPTAAGAKGRRGGFDPNRAMPVQAGTVRQGDMDIVLNALGTITASNTVTVHTRVDGQLTRIAFQEGQLVKAGAVLAQIDPRPFQVQYDQMQGQLARDEAQLVNAQVDLNRYQDLLAQDSIAKQQVDAQAALVRQYQGTVKSDRAQVANAALQLSYATVTAPISGRLGLRQVDVGNIVHASDANGLVVITQTQPATVVFSIPSDNLPAVSAQMREGKTLTVDAYDREGKIKLAEGKLLTVDNQIDVTTGTVKLKAQFANRDNTLFPNQFVNVRLKVETRHNVILAPVASIQRGTPGTFVYVITPESKVELRPVTLGQTSGDVVAIEKGLHAGEQVVIDGADKLKQGAKVELIKPQARNAGAPGANRSGTGKAGGRRHRNADGAPADNAGGTQALRSGQP